MIVGTCRKVHLPGHDEFDPKRSSLEDVIG
jgi:hypothetical protein